MNKHELEQKLNDLGIDPDSYSLNGECMNETLCLENNYGRWSIFYSERGLRTNEEIFDSEDKACNAFLVRIKKMFGI